MLSKKQLLQKVRKETKPQKGFSQWVVVLERKRLTADTGLLRLEAQLDGKAEWSGSISIALPEQTKFAADGREIPSEWDAISIGQAKFNVFTLEVRGKTVGELVKGFLKRSVEEGKIQDLLPW